MILVEKPQPGSSNDIKEPCTFHALKKALVNFFASQADKSLRTIMKRIRFLAN